MATSDDARPIYKYSPITWASERLFRALQFLPPQVFLRGLDAQKSPATPELAAKRSLIVEAYVATMVTLEVLLICLYVAGLAEPLFVQVFAVLRIIDIAQVTVNVAVFDQLRRRHAITSRERSLVLTFVSFMELIVCFGLLYLTGLNHLTNATSWQDALYFSAITQLTIGYGDMAPTGWLRPWTVAQGVLGLLLVVVALARLLNTFGSFDRIFKTDKSAG